MSRKNLSHRHELVSIIQEYGINLEEKELFLHSSFDQEETGVDFRMATQFQKNMRMMKDKPVLIHMHTIGGIWHDGMAIYDTIKSHISHVTILCYGHVGSMSSIIPQAADHRVMMPNAEFMIHYGYCGYNQNYIGYISDAEQNKKYAELMLDIYTDKCSSGERFIDWTPRRIKNFLVKQMQKKQEVYLTAREAVEWGFADAVLGDEGYETIDSLKSN
jgi:ATP-dependent protease ClpP protease subunit